MPSGDPLFLRFENKTFSNLTIINVVVNLPFNIRTKSLSYFLLGQFVVPFKYIVLILGANTNKNLANFVKDRICKISLYLIKHIHWVKQGYTYEHHMVLNLDFIGMKM